MTKSPMLKTKNRQAMKRKLFGRKLGIGVGVVVCYFILSSPCLADTASYYSVESCKREGTWQKFGGRMANGEVFADEKMVCAAWGYKFGTLLRVTNLATGKTVVVRVADRGPAKRLYRMGRKIDLSKGAFAKISPLAKGIIKVQIERIN